MSLSDSNRTIQIPYFWEAPKNDIDRNLWYHKNAIFCNRSFNYHWCQFVSKLTYGIYNTDYSKQHRYAQNIKIL